MLTGFLGLVVQWVMPSLTTAIMGFILALVRKQLKKAGLELTAQQEAQLRELVQRVIRRIEEEATADEKTAPKATSKEKLEAAIGEIIERTGVAPERARDLVHEELPKVRASSAWNRTINPGLPGGGRR